MAYFLGRVLCAQIHGRASPPQPVSAPNLYRVERYLHRDLGRLLPLHHRIIGSTIAAVCSRSVPAQARRRSRPYFRARNTRRTCDGPLPAVLEPLSVSLRDVRFGPEGPIVARERKHAQGPLIVRLSLSLLRNIMESVLLPLGDSALSDLSCLRMLGFLIDAPSFLSLSLPTAVAAVSGYL
jgi:hypothetical protein